MVSNAIPSLHVATASHMNNDPAALSRAVLSDLTTGKTRLGHLVLSFAVFSSQEFPSSSDVTRTQDLSRQWRYCVLKVEIYPVHSLEIVSDNRRKRR